VEICLAAMKSGATIQIEVNKMSVETSTKPLDLEHELPSMEKSDDVQTPDSTSGEAERKATSFGHASQDDDNDPAKLRERLARLQADFENVRKRLLKEQLESRESAEFDTVKALLPVLDSLEQALQASPSDGMDLRTGVALIHKQLLEVLFKIGVRPINALGERFDPRIHHAIATVDTDLVQDQLVVGELQCGYKFKDRLLRPAMVTVARKLPPEFSS
jgi:molecular chaperone GrpE (heat shock protein)